MRRLGSSFPWALGVGLIGGAIVHIAVVLAVPGMAEHDAYARLAAYGGGTQAGLVPHDLPDVSPPLPDPAVAMAVCAYDLKDGPLRIAMKDAAYFESLSLQAQGGTVFYALTDRAAVRGGIELAVMTQRQLDETVAQEGDEDVPSELRVVAPTRRGLVVVRALAPFPSLRNAAEKAATSVRCVRN
jgi:uncharacterized membrane protein